VENRIVIQVSLGKKQDPIFKLTIAKPGTGGSCFNPTYSGGSDQEDHGLKPAQANSSLRPYLEKLLHEKGMVEWLKVQALSSSHTHKKVSAEKKGCGNVPD
jgi:hypothetical protein